MCRNVKKTDSKKRGRVERARRVCGEETCWRWTSELFFLQRSTFLHMPLVNRSGDCLSRSASSQVNARGQTEVQQQVTCGGSLIDPREGHSSSQVPRVRKPPRSSQADGHQDVLRHAESHDPLFIKYTLHVSVTARHLAHFPYSSNPRHGEE